MIEKERIVNEIFRKKKKIKGAPFRNVFYARRIINCYQTIQSKLSVNFSNNHKKYHFNILVMHTI